MSSHRLYLGIFAIIGFLIIGYLTYDRQPPQNQNQKLQAEIQQRSNSQPSQSPETPEGCTTDPTPVLTEGPYYKTGSPERSNLLEISTVGIKLSVTGYVFDANCHPIANAWLDFWQADGDGNYDNFGYKLRGHQYTDSSGKFVLETVIPGRYSSRTPHIHVKIRADENSPVLTSQLFMPQEPLNRKDAIFNQSLVMKIQDKEDGKFATFNIVIIK